TTDDAQDKNGWSVLSRNEKDTVTVRVQNIPCTDSMSGEAFQNQVMVEVNAQTLQGCGGGQLSPLNILWQLENMDGKRIDRSGITLILKENGHYSGEGGCNQYGGDSYTLDGERIIWGSGGFMTQRACVTPQYRFDE